MRQPRHAHRAHPAGHRQKVHAQTRRPAAGQRDADVAVEDAQRRVVARDHHRAAGVPLAAPRQQARRCAAPLDRAVEPGSAPQSPSRTAHSRRKRSKAVSTQCTQAACAAALVTSAGRLASAAGSRGSRPGPPAATAAPAARRRRGSTPSSAVHGAAGVVRQQLAGHAGSIARFTASASCADRAAKAAALAQHDGVLGQRGRRCLAPAAYCAGNLAGGRLQA
jgi:hypothetical protein